MRLALGITLIGLCVVGLVGALAVLAWLLWIELVARGFVRVDREFNELRLGRWVMSLKRQPDLHAGPCSLPWPHERCNGWACDRMVDRLAQERLAAAPGCAHANTTPLADGTYACLECKRVNVTREELMESAQRASAQRSLEALFNSQRPL